MAERRESKKRETRQRISDVATTMFLERGFEAVTLDEIAVAAKVSKMTVFNYFARKEELMLDREDELLLIPFRDAIRARAGGQSPIDAIRQLLDDEQPSFTTIRKHTLAWWRVINGSPSLLARLRELADQATEGLAVELGGSKPDGLSRLVAGVIVLTVRVAREEAVRVLERGGSEKKANATLRALIERGLAAAQALATA